MWILAGDVPLPGSRVLRESLPRFPVFMCKEHFTKVRITEMLMALDYLPKQVRLKKM